MVLGASGALGAASAALVAASSVFRVGTSITPTSHPSPGGRAPRRIASDWRRKPRRGGPSTSKGTAKSVTSATPPRPRASKPRTPRSKRRRTARTERGRTGRRRSAPSRRRAGLRWTHQPPPTSTVPPACTPSFASRCLRAINSGAALAAPAGAPPPSSVPTATSSCASSASPTSARGVPGPRSSSPIPIPRWSLSRRRCRLGLRTLWTGRRCRISATEGKETRTIE